MKTKENKRHIPKPEHRSFTFQTPKNYKLKNDHKMMEYLQSKSWKCKDSPTGSHFWDIGETAVCRYCKEVRGVAIQNHI